MKRDYSLYIKDILDSISLIEDFIGNINFDEFTKDKKTSSAVIYQIEIIGEAAKQIPKDKRTKYQAVPWQDMAGMRDKIIHFYFGVDHEIVWKVIKEDLPILKKEFVRILAELKGEV